MNHHHTHLLIGAGPVGLAVAHALKRAKIPYDHVEADDDVGGNWYHGVYEHVRLVSSKRFTQYPIYPMPSAYPHFPSAPEMLAYYRRFANVFGLTPNIQFRRKVVLITPDASSRWHVTFDDGHTHTYNGVIVCAGQHWHKHYPNIDGNFDGQWLHAKDYKSPTNFTNKRVLVIGAGNSGCDIAQALIPHAQKVHWSVRTGPWFVPRYLGTKPLAEWLPKQTPPSMERAFTMAILRMLLGSNTQYNLPHPNHRLFERLPTTNTSILKHVKSNELQTHPAPTQLHGHRVTFDNNTHADVDAIICATGYDYHLPFFPKGLLHIQPKRIDLIAGSLVPHYKNLYIVGMVQSRKGLGTLATPYAELLANLILAQSQIEEPLGNILMAMGFGPFHHRVLEPAHILMQLKHGAKVSRALPSIAKRINQSPSYTPASPRFNWDATPDLNLRVY